MSLKKNKVHCRHRDCRPVLRHALLLSILMPISVSAVQDLPSFNATPDVQNSMACLIEPFQQSDIGSPVAGVIEQIHVERGDTVKKGDILASLDKSVDEATLKLHRAEAAYANRVVSRNKSLHDRKLLPASNFDEMNSKARMANLQVQLQQVILKERDVLSPYDAVVVERHAGLGDRIHDNKILTIAQIDPLLVRVVVPEDRYGTITEGQTARVNVNPAISAEPLQATVWRIDKVMDAASGTFVVLLSLPNDSHIIPAGLRCTIQF